MLRIAIHGDLTLAGRKLHCQYVGAREPKSAPQITILNMPVAGRKKKKKRGKQEKHGGIGAKVVIEITVGTCYTKPLKSGFTPLF